jgi:hypothetical protein
MHFLDSHFRGNDKLFQPIACIESSPRKRGSRTICFYWSILDNHLTLYEYKPNQNQQGSACKANILQKVRTLQLTCCIHDGRCQWLKKYW